MSVIDQGGSSGVDMKYVIAEEKHEEEARTLHSLDPVEDSSFNDANCVDEVDALYELCEFLNNIFYLFI